MIPLHKNRVVKPPKGLVYHFMKRKKPKETVFQTIGKTEILLLSIGMSMQSSGLGFPSSGGFAIRRFQNWGFLMSMTIPSPLS